MKRQDVELIVTEYLKPIYGFVLKRTKTYEDAEDLTQDIMLKIYNSLIKKDNIEDISKYVWTIAHNALNNYYRDYKVTIGVSEEVIDNYIDDKNDNESIDTISRLHKEIAYLSKLQRQIIIAYYFENKKQEQIAKDLNIPIGTVKWHLFEAKKDLKRSMEKMRNLNELKFNPIKFASVGINGSIGTKSIDDYFKSTLVQNICYVIKDEPKTINEIADLLGVSPVYVETEIEYLEENLFVIEKNKKYLSNILIFEPSDKLIRLQDEMYKKAAKVFANELFDELVNSKLLEDNNIICYQTDDEPSMTESKRADNNYILWSLIPYIAANSGEYLMEDKISFDEVATIRPDGGHNICHADVVNKINYPDNYIYMKGYSGPFWNSNDKGTLWMVDTEWSNRRIGVDVKDQEIAQRTLSLLTSGELLSKYDYALLSQYGYIKTVGEYDKEFKVIPQIVMLHGKEVKDKLISIGDKIKEKYKDYFNEIKQDYIKECLSLVPKHLRKVREYELQFIFGADGWFMVHILYELVNNGKLKLPTEEQRKSLSIALIVE